MSLSCEYGSGACLKDMVDQEIDDLLSNRGTYPQAILDSALTASTAEDFNEALAKAAEAREKLDGLYAERRATLACKVCPKVHKRPRK
jgi:hypothetical protein